MVGKSQFSLGNGSSWVTHSTVNDLTSMHTRITLIELNGLWKGGHEFGKNTQWVSGWSWMRIRFDIIKMHYIYICICKKYSKNKVHMCSIATQPISSDIFCCIFSALLSFRKLKIQQF